MVASMKKPNIVFILVDDMGYGDFSRFNNGLTKTPTIDNLIEEGTCLTQHYTASPVCNPSRATLMTGRYPQRTGSIDTLEWRGLERLALKEITIADMLKKAGYRTGLIGKWHLGAFDKRYHPNKRGFDDAVCFRGGMHDYYKWRLEYNYSVKKSDGTYLTDLFTNEAVSFIEHNRDNPFFLHLSYNAPHTPLQVPEDEAKPFAETGKFTNGVSTLYGMISRMDKGVSKVLEALKKCGVENNTLVFFTSDNGPQFGGEGENRLDRFNCNFHGSKGHVYEGGIRVPMIIKWPDGLDKSKVCNNMVHFADWFPTLLEIAGVEKPSHLKLDGINVLPVLKGEKGKIVTKRFWEWNRYVPTVTSNAAMRDGDWKLVKPVVENGFEVPDIKWLDVCMYEHDYFLTNDIIRDAPPERNLGPEKKIELYNLADDPLETVDLSHKHPDKVHKMKTELENWFEDVQSELLSVNDDPV